MSMPSTSILDCNSCINYDGCEKKAERSIQDDCGMFIDDGVREYELYFGRDPIDIADY